MMGQVVAVLGGHGQHAVLAGGGINPIDFAKSSADFAQFSPFKLLIFAVFGLLAATAILIGVGAGLINTSRLAIASVKSNEMHAAKAQAGIRLSTTAIGYAAFYGVVVFVVLTVVSLLATLASK